jgi:hypothetical protein
MPVQVGSGSHVYEEVVDWAKLPDGWDFIVAAPSSSSTHDDQGAYLGQWNNLHRPAGLHIVDDTVYITQLATTMTVNLGDPNLGACVTTHDLSGRRLARLGGAQPGDGPGQFSAPHGCAVDSRGALYVGEVAWSGYGRALDPPLSGLRSFRKLAKV